MRAAWHTRLPALARIYGIRPWELDRLSHSELNGFWEDLMEMEHRARG